MRKLFRRIHYWINRRRLEHELAEEIESHRSMKEEDFARSGLPPCAAAASSRRVMGNSLLAREDSGGVWIAPWFDQLYQNIGYGLRQLRRNPVKSRFVRSV